MSNNEFGCLLIVVIVVGFGILLGVGAAIKQSGLETRIEKLEQP